MLQTRTKAYTHSLVAVLISTLVGCGGKSTTFSTQSTAGPSGKVIQGAVSGATTWADGLSAGTRFLIDSSEQSTQATSDSSGVFTLPASPSYKYVLASQGGTDTITGKTAITMIAPGGSKTVSPFTTLVALDTSGNFVNTLSGLLPAGASFDSDFTVSNGLTPAAMVLITSITTAITTFDSALQAAATKGGATISAQQLNNINLTLYSQIATQFSTQSAASLANTASLAATLQTALSNALGSIATNNTNIAGLNSSTISQLAQTIANNSVAVAANVVGNATGDKNLQGVTPSNVQTTGVSVALTGTVTEAAVLGTAGGTQAINNVITTVSASASTSLTVTSTPSNYSPPVIPIINNPMVVGYKLLATISGNAWTVNSFTITFSDDMVASASGSSNFAHSVLNPANYQFTQSGCTPASYAANVVTFNCGTVQAGVFGVTVLKSNSTLGVWASSTSLGLIVDNNKSFTLPVTTGSTGGSSLSLF